MNDLKNVIDKIPVLKAISSKKISASIFIPFVKVGDDWSILLEKRALNLKHQPGEVCFPGGKREGEETPDYTAVRETAEELCIDESTIEVIGQLSTSFGPGGRQIGIYVGIINDYHMSFDEKEVDSVYPVSLKWLLETEPDGYVVDMVTVPREDFPFDKIPGGRDYPWTKPNRMVYFYEYKDLVIWGFTAGVLKDFISIIK